MRSCFDGFDWPSRKPPQRQEGTPRLVLRTPPVVIRPASEGRAQDGTTGTTGSIHTSAIRGASAADAAEGQLRCHFATDAMRARRQGGQSLPGCPFLRVERAGRVGIAVFSMFGSGALSCCSSGVSGIEVLGRAGSLSSRLVGMNRSTARVIVCPGSSILDAINGFHSIHRPCEVRSGLWRTQDSSAGSFSFFCVVCPQQTNSASVQFCNIQLVLGKV